jgi:uncharacterized membrane protein YeaQ/YmgE (transglycosylase-associated protein family)
MANLFISYSSADRDIALRLANTLESNGHVVWIDNKGIKGGTKWAAEIVKAIGASDLIVLLLSPDALTSDNVRKEIDLAAEENKSLLPVLIKPVSAIPVDFKYHLAGLQHIDVTLDYERGVRTLLTTIPNTVQDIIPDYVAQSYSAPSTLPLPTAPSIEPSPKAAEVKPKYAPTSRNTSPYSYIIIGMIGSFIGGSIFSMLGLSGVSGLNIGSILPGILGAVILLLITDALRRK